MSNGSDLVLNVRQIGQYPLETSATAGDLLLLQQGGVGGPYKTINPFALVESALADGAAAYILLGTGGILDFGGPTINVQSNVFVMNRGLSMQGPLIAGSSQLEGDVTVDGLLTVHGGINADGFINAGGAVHSGPVTIDGGALNVTGGPTVLNGSLNVAGPITGGAVTAASVTINGDPVLTARWVQAFLNNLQQNMVNSFNGRTGKVQLTDVDIDVAYRVPQGDTLVLRSTMLAEVNATVCKYVNDLYNTQPLVFTWNGRVGDVFLTLDDIEHVFFCPGSEPRAPTPIFGDVSTRIATTAFVDDAITVAANEMMQEWSAADEYLLNLIQTQYAPLNSPDFTGIPQVPTAASGTNTAQIASTAFVMAAVAASVSGVATFNTRSGNVVLEDTDITGAGGALLNSPSFIGTPLAPTPPVSDNSQRLATTAFVMSEITAIDTGVLSWNGRVGIVTLSLSDVTGAGGAPLASPGFTGTPTAPTANAGTSTTQIATTAFVMQNSVATFNGRTGAISLMGNDISAAGGALLAGPAFTGAPTAPTAVPGTSTTQLATTAFVQAALSGISVGVASFNTRTGAVTLALSDITGAGGAPLASPALTGVPTGPTAAPGTNTNQLATTAFVQAAQTQVTVQTFSSGSGTYVSPAGARRIKVRLIGGGGGGGSFAAGAAGGNTTFGPHTAGGGGPGGVGAGGVAGNNVLGSGSFFGSSGSIGSYGALSIAGTMNGIGGDGGSSPLGGGGKGSYGTTGSAATGAGGGGAGGGAAVAAGTVPSGGGGASGGYIEALMAPGNYPYSIGAGGGGQGPGSNIAAGGQGANGVVIVEEYY